MYLHIDEKKLELIEKGKNIVYKYEKSNDNPCVNWQFAYSSHYYDVYLLKEDWRNIRYFNIKDALKEYILSNTEILQYLYIKIIIKEEKKRLLFRCKEIKR